MNIVFGMHLDGSEWSQKAASLGQLQLGPTGLLSLLETQLGLNGLTVHPAQRINEYMQRLEHVDCSDAWFHRSLEADSWSTAKQMLAWRDELVGAGWNGLAGESISPRLQSLADAEVVTVLCIQAEKTAYRKFCTPWRCKAIAVSHPFILRSRFRYFHLYGKRHLHCWNHQV